MQERSFRQDLTGSDESLDDLMSRLKAQLSRPKAWPIRNPPSDFDHFVTSRRPRGGAGGAEAPLPKPDRGLADCHAH
ncbi:MAG: hypothetical protein EPO51_18200 [Phenylobacterium sp.]|uniref:hypothetical protein n=1 Tax=Phenylobacterium sp. TaxID=1871053 RepID=UPI0011F925E7|nr:hypothetical protein [Phenylobacterium sp.]TAJ70461.1 MAG: hypothetical protein EPO51_18200 [Phenylobacterium sp.]